MTQPRSQKGWNQEDENPNALAPIPLNYKVSVVTKTSLSYQQLVLGSPQLAAAASGWKLGTEKL